MTQATIEKIKEKRMKTYTFKVIVEPDEDRWYAYCPILESEGATTWGYTKEEALKNIREVVEMVIESMVEYNEPIPTEPSEDVRVFDNPLVAVTIQYMPIDYGRLRNVSTRHFVKALKKDGFFLERKKGSSHQKYRHLDNRKVTISYHNPSETFKTKTLKAIIKQAQWTEDDLKRLKLLK